MSSFSMSMLISNEVGHVVVRTAGPCDGPRITFILNDWIQKYSAKRKKEVFEVKAVESYEHLTLPMGPMQFIFLSRNN